MRAVRALACLLALGLGVPARALAEEPPTDASEVAAEARAHYQVGQKAVEEGDYERAVAEFERAYALKAHPNVLYNLGNAYERLQNYPRSVEFFDRYLRDSGADAEHRVIVEHRLKVLRSLPARITVSTIPEHVHARLIGGGQTLEADTPTVFKAPAGAYTLALEQPGWEPEAHNLKADIGQPYFYQYRLKRSSEQVVIFSRPRGARVFIDDKLVGETPWGDEVEVGKHRLLLEHPDYPWYRQNLEVKSGAPQKLEVKLTRPIRSGRTELVVASMIYGGVAGPLLVAALSTNSNFIYTGPGLAVILASSVAGIGAGFLGSFLPTRDGIKVGHSSLIIGGGAWGTALGASLALGLKVPAQYAYGMSLLGGAIGITTGALVSRWKDVYPGTAGIFNSGGFWGTASGALLAQAIFDHPSADQLGWFLVGGTAVGLIAGGLVAWKVDRTRGHVLLVDVGGLAGSGLGFALGYAVGATSADGNGVQAGSRYALGGMVLGILAASVLSRNYKGDLPPVEALLSHQHGKWALALPDLKIEQAITPEGTAPRVVLTLAKGRW